MSAMRARDIPSRPKTRSAALRICFSVRRLRSCLRSDSRLERAITSSSRRSHSGAASGAFAAVKDSGPICTSLAKTLTHFGNFVDFARLRRCVKHRPICLACSHSNKQIRPFDRRYEAEGGAQASTGLSGPQEIFSDYFSILFDAGAWAG
ncbi:hypothetical protein ERY430_50127 [Erythrobacter sp. EC-HK427]|nr:hypothetical protein ERY430_50127 [Erythrobacter sp. EC-HK427]